MVNYAESYSRALAQTYPKSMYFGVLFSTPNNEVYKVVDGRTIKIPSITTKGRVDGDRDSIGSFTRGSENAWETKTLENHRIFKDLVHPMDVNQTNMVLSIQNITSVFNAEQKIPEKQKYLVSKLYDTVLSGAAEQVKEMALTSDNVLAEIDRIAEIMDEASVPSEGRVLYVTPAINTLIKNAKELSRYLGATDSTVSRTINRVDDFVIVSVPSDLMKTKYDFTEGAVTGVGAKQIHMFAGHPSAVITPESYTYVGIQEPSTVTEGKWAYFEEAFEDVFILEKRIGALHFVVKAEG